MTWQVALTQNAAIAPPRSSVRGLERRAAQALAPVAAPRWPTRRAAGVLCRYQPEERTPVVPDSPDRLMIWRAEKDMADYCSVHPELKQCWSVHDWFVAKCKKAEEHEQHLGTNAEYVLQRTLREIMSAGDIDEVYRSLNMLKQIEERRRTGQPAVATAVASTPLPCCVIGEQERLLLTQLFQQMDTNGDGRLSWSEFMAALHDIDDDLEEEEQELVSSALDLHGTLSLDQFLAVVQQAEELRAERDSNCDARRLRHITHRDRRPDHVDRAWGGAFM